MKTFSARPAALVLMGVLIAGGMTGEASAQTAGNLVCKGCVGKKDIGKDAVDMKRLAPNAKPAGISYTERSGETVTFSKSAKVIASVKLKAPASGLVTVFANGYFDFDGVGAETLAGCSINTGKGYAEPHATIALGSNADRIHTVSTSRVFEVSKGKTKFRLVCRTGSNATVEIQNPKLTAIYVPQEY